jgi:DNA helicase IV
LRLPNLDDLIAEQWSVYRHPADASLFAVGPPGSGKTTLAVHRARRLAEERQTVVIVTKNRMLAALAQQLGGTKLRSRTMSTVITTDHSRRCGSHAPERRPYVYDWDAIFANYEQRRLPPMVDHLVVDEGQNLPVGFLRWARRFGGKFLSVFADENQTSANDGSSLQEIVDAGLPNPIRLSRNHRNTPEIAAVAEHFHDSMLVPPAVVTKPPSGEAPRMIEIDDWRQLVQPVMTRALNRGGSIGVIMYRKTEASLIHRLLRAVASPTMRVDLYTSDGDSGAENIRLLDPGITILTGQSVIGLEFDTVYLVDMERSLPCTSDAKRRTMYMLCARARDSLVLIDGPHRLTNCQLDALPNPPTLQR